MGLQAFMNEIVWKFFVLIVFFPGMNGCMAFLEGSVVRRKKRIFSTLIAS